MPSQHVSKLALPTIALSLMTVMSAVAGLNIALPGIAVETEASQTQLTWIVDSYTVIFAGLLLLAGALGDRYGRQRVLLIGLAVFAIGAAIGVFQTTPDGLIFARIIMGIGAAAIMPSTLSVITSSFPEEDRGKAIGVWVGVAGGGAVLGLFATALLLEWFEWNSFFYLNLSLALVSIAGTLAIPNSHEKSGSLDWLGGALSVLGVGGVVFGIIEGPDKGWDSTETVSGLGVGIAALLVFVLWEFRARNPLLDPRLFALRGFTSGTMSITIQFFAQFGFIFVGMQYLQFVAGFSPLEAAAHLLWMPLVVLPGSRIAGHLSKKVPQKYLGSIGLAVFGYAMFHFAGLPKDFDYWYFTTGILLFGLGLALSATPATVAITSALPAEKQGVASAVNDTAREVGAALGIAILGAALADTYKAEIAPSIEQLPVKLAEHIERGVAFTAIDPPPQLAPFWDELVRAGLDAFAVGIQNSLNIAGWVALSGALFVLIVAPRNSPN